MTLTEQVKILDNKIKANQAQYDLDRESAKISALSSGELKKYEYLTGEDLGYKPRLLEKIKFQYSPLGEALKNNGESKAEKVVKKTKRINNFLVYNQQHSFEKLRVSVILKKCHLILCIKNWMNFIKNLRGLKILLPN